jgi:hypothetical protein
MGGFGSGRHPWSSRDTVEDFRDRTIGIAIADWVKRGLVQPGNAGRLEWPAEDGRPAASLGVWIVLQADRLQARLKYQVQAGWAPENWPQEDTDIEEVVMLARSGAGLRGHSWLFYCPGCGRRVAELYLNEAYFRCRKCCGLGYRSQRETREDRGLEKAARIKQQLGGEGDLDEPFPERPKGMRRRTYERLRQQAEAGEVPYQERMDKHWQRALGSATDLLRSRSRRRRRPQDPAKPRRRGSRPAGTGGSPGAKMTRRTSRSPRLSPGEAP